MRYAYSLTGPVPAPAVAAPAPVPAETPGNAAALSIDELTNAVEADANHVYFYAPVTPRSALELTRKLRQTKSELARKAIEIGAEAPPIVLHVHSYGGTVHAGLALYDTVRTLGHAVDTVVDGVAASAATLITSAGRRRSAHENAQILIHQLSGGFWGTYRQMQDDMENNDLLMRQIRAVYLRHSRMEPDALEALLARDLFLDAERALELGLLDEIITF